MEVTSTKVATVRRAARLRKRAFRRADERFLAEGPQAVREALASPGVVQEVFATADFEARHPEFQRTAIAQDVQWHRASGAVVAHLSDTVTPQGVVAVCRAIGEPLSAVIRPQARLAVLVAQGRDPGNAGTVIRVADAAGADGVVFSHGSVDPWNPKTVRSSAGSSFHLPVCADADIAEMVDTARSAGMVVVAADGTGQSLFAADVDFAAPTLWVFGNEAWGLPHDIRELCDHVVAVPIFGRAESLNLATAAAVCLYTSARAQQVHS
jgi:RNA methyltransferase, TrmH family